MKLFNATLALTAATVLGLAATSAVAGDVSVSLRYDSGRRLPPPQPYCGPVYQQTTIVSNGYGRVWVPPVFQTTTENVWHAPVTQDQVSRQWMPDRYVVQPVNTLDPYGRPITVNQPVLIEPAHWQEAHTPIVVQAGYYAPETKTVCVADGYWQTVQQPVVYVAPAPPPAYCWPDRGPRQDVYVRYDSRRDDSRHDDRRDDRHDGGWRR